MDKLPNPLNPPGVDRWEARPIQIAQLDATSLFVPATVYKNCGVFKQTADRQFSLTHLPTGYNIARFKLKKTAKEVAEALEKEFDLASIRVKDRRTYGKGWAKVLKEAPALMESIRSRLEGE